MKNIKEGINLDDVKFLLSTGQRMAITTRTFEKIIDLLEEKTAECEEREQDAENWAYKAGLATGKASRYRKALEDIERHFECRCDICRDNYGLGADCSVCWHKDIRNIISRVKVGK